MEGEFDVREVFLELRVPILADTPFFELLEIQAACLSWSPPLELELEELELLMAIESWRSSAASRGEETHSSTRRVLRCTRTKPRPQGDASAKVVIAGGVG